MVCTPVHSGSLIDWIWFPLEPPVQGRKYQTAQAGDFLVSHTLPDLDPMTDVAGQVLISNTCNTLPAGLHGPS